MKTVRSNASLNFCGIVQHGWGSMGTLGIPTANVYNTTIPCGIYNADTTFGRAHVLVSPNGLAETHILNYSGDLYGKTLCVNDMQLSSSCEGCFEDTYNATCATYNPRL